MRASTSTCSPIKKFEVQYMSCYCWQGVYKLQLSILLYNLICRFRRQQEINIINAKNSIIGDVPLSAIVLKLAIYEKPYFSILVPLCITTAMKKKNKCCVLFLFWQQSLKKETNTRHRPCEIQQYVFPLTRKIRLKNIQSSTGFTELTVTFRCDG